ncbi:MAG: DUF1330 domain-containing protein [Hyphomicrobiales bacterium]|nr:DUF1330 domain-containing protein [Hyphomicrobiales bacterium]
MAAYVIFELAPLDPVGMKAYLDGANTSMSLHGGTLLAATGDVEPREGGWNPERIAIIEFPDLEKARWWYESAEYQEVLPLRLKESSTDRMIIVPGLN